MFSNIFNDEAIRELATIIAEQEAHKTAKNTLAEMEKKSIGLSKQLKSSIDAILAEICVGNVEPA